MVHVVICDNKTKELEKIINKSRTMLLRGNEKRRIPHSRIFIGDELYLLEKGDNSIKFHAIVSNAESYQKLSKEEIDKIIDTYNDKLNLTKEEEVKWKHKCICLIEFDNLEEIDPINIRKYTPLEDWIMCESIDDLKC